MIDETIKDAAFAQQNAYDPNWSERPVLIWSAGYDAGHEDGVKAMTTDQPIAPLSDAEMAREREMHVQLAPPWEPRSCSGCLRAWPCQGVRLLAMLDAERARTERLREALERQLVVPFMQYGRELYECSTCKAQGVDVADVGHWPECPLGATPLSRAEGA